MNRKDRAIADQTDCIQLLRRCDTLRLGLWDGTMPYVVPEMCIRDRDRTGCRGWISAFSLPQRRK